MLYLNKQSNNLDKLIIYNISGKAILSKNLNSALSKETIDVSSISEGFYFVEVIKGSSKHISKIIISK